VIPFTPSERSVIGVGMTLIEQGCRPANDLRGRKPRRYCDEVHAADAASLVGVAWELELNAGEAECIPIGVCDVRKWQTRSIKLLLIALELPCFFTPT
jgi:hypothetical protein